MVTRSQSYALPSHHFLDDFPQSASLYVLRDEVEPLVFVQDSNEFEHIGVIQATHDLYLINGQQQYYENQS